MELEKTVEVLKQEGIILYPTDTIWGLGCDATSQKAIENLTNLKGRGKKQRFIILLEDDRKLNKYVKEIPEVAWDLLDSADKPLTIIYPNAVSLPQNLIAEDGSIAIRIVKDGFVNKLIRKLNKPLVSTSANITGEPSPKSKAEISKKIIENVNHIVNLQTENRNAKPSSIVKLQISGEIEIIRK